MVERRLILHILREDIHSGKTIENIADSFPRLHGVLKVFQEKRRLSLQSFREIWKTVQNGKILLLAQAF